MAVGVIWHPPVDKQAGKDKGMKFHAAGEADDGWRIIEVWESRDGLERFIREDLARAFDELGGDEGGPPRPDSVFDVSFQSP